MAPRRIGELLVAEGLLTEGAVQRALGYQRLSGERIKLGSILLNWDLLGEDVLLESLAKLHRCQAVTWEMLLATPIETVRLLPAAQAIRIGAVPWAVEKGVIRVAFINPSNLASIDEVASLTRRRVVPGVTTEARLLQAHQRYYGRHVPLEYRPILQKLDRRSTTSTKIDRDFRSSDISRPSDVVQSDLGSSHSRSRSSDERDSAVSPRSTSFEGTASVPIRVEIQEASAEPRPRAERSDPVLEMPDVSDFPIAAAASAGLTMLPETKAEEEQPSNPTGPDKGRSGSPVASFHPSDSSDSLESAEESLTDWVGEALSAFTEGPRGGSGRFDSERSSSSAGVSDPSLFGREASALASDPEALDLLPETNALRDRPTNSMRPHAHASRRIEPDSLPSEAHSRGIPASIPPFRRASDPALFEDLSDPGESDPGEVEVEKLEDAGESDAVAAGMWNPSSAEEASAPGSTALDAAAGAGRRDEVADSLLEGALETLPRVLLLASGRSGVTGWRGRGPGMTPDVVSGIRVPVSEISIFSSVQESGVPHFGAVDPAEWPRSLVAVFGPEPPDCAIFPIRILDGVAAFLYADRLGAPMQYEDFAIVARASASAANVLSRFLLRSDRSSSPVRS